MRLIIPILLNCLLAAAVYAVDKYTPAKKMPYMLKQVIIGLLFGGVSAFASSFGVELLGTMVNVRDAAPLTAGLIFGAPAGIISGIIGGLYRWFSVAWGAGTYTRLACTIATVLAGLMAAGIRKLMFDDKKPTWGYGVCITVVCEVIHMVLIFLTNMDDSAYAFEFVKGATLPMTVGNAMAVGISIIVISLFNHERLVRKKGEERIAQTFQRYLLICIVIAFMITSSFTFFLQDSMANIETQEVFTTAISDVQEDVRGKSDDYMLEIVHGIVSRYEQNPDTSLEALADEYEVIEINIVSDDGLIINSTENILIGSFNMNSTEQSKEFMVLTGELTEYVQEYGAIGRDNKTMRKYAGVSLSTGGFIQVGYSTEQFHKMLDGFVVDVTKNRHVGSNGFVAVCDEQLNMVTENNRDGDHISSIGIVPNEQMKNGKSAESLCEATVVNRENGYAEEYIYAFTFVEGYCIIAAMPQNEAMFMRDASAYNAIFMQILVFAILFVFIYVLIKRVIINNLNKVNASLARITDGNLDVVVDVRSNAEFSSLSDDINSTVSTLKRYISEAAARIDKELEYAKQIQLGALPANFPDTDSYCIYAQMTAAKEVGGDFYDFYRLNDKEVAFLVADVSGKGIPAAMFMMTAKTIIKDLAERGMAADEIFTEANAKLCVNNESGMFVTAWMGILNIESGKLYYANAGHNPPLIMHKNGEFEYLRTRSGFVLAGLEGFKYRLHELDLSAGDRIFLYTDGVTEAVDENEQLYGEGRLIDYMNRNKTAEASSLLVKLKADIDAFAGTAPQFDDITMLMLDYRAENAQRRTFPARVDALDDVLGFVEGELEKVGCPTKTVTAIAVAIEEVFVNIAHYAYDEAGGNVDFEFKFEEESRTVTLRIADRGVKFDPLESPEPDITLSAQERRIGGLGILIAKKTMDNMAYAYENGENILTMAKKI